MEITLILGNGFDKNLGLKTSYKEFFEWYLNEPCDNDVIKKMKKSIGYCMDGSKKEIINWSDAELAFGQYSKNCDNYQDYRLCYENIHDKLDEYLKDKEKDFDINKISDDKIIACIIELVKTINTSGNQTGINVVTLNYTSSCYEIFYKVKDILKDPKYNIVIKDYLYLHGGLVTEPTFGVGDVAQIANGDLIKKCHPVFLNQIIKARHDVLSTRNCYQKIDYMLNKSNAIYCYGMSFGDTDSFLIKKMSLAVKSGKRLYVYKYGFELKSEIRKSLEKEEFNYNNKEIICKKLKLHGQLNDYEYNIIRAHVLSTCENCFEQIKNVV